MPGSVTINEATGQPVIAADADFAMVVVGAASSPTLGSNVITPPYSNPGALASDNGIGDGVDAAIQALKKTAGNPAPPPVALLPTPATNDGTYGTIDISDVAGTCDPAEDTSTSPLGTYQVRVRVTDDGNDGAGTAIGTSGIVLQASVDDGRTWLPTSDLGTATTFTVYLPATTPISTGVKFILQPAPASLTALYTKVTLLQTTLTGTGHFTIVSGGTPVHAAADNAGDTALAAVPAATTPATCVTLFNAIKQYLGTHGASAVFHAGADAPLATALAAIPTATNVADVDLYLDNLIVAYEAHRINVTSVHGSADSTNTISAYTSAPGTLKTDDEWSIATKCPTWAVADLYTAPDSGAFAAIAESSYNFAIIVITEPVASSDFATLVTGLDYIAGFGKRCAVLMRFRDPNAGESDSAYITAFRTFAAACVDNRFAVVAGTGRLTDAFRGYVYQRSGLPALLARLQSNAAVPGRLGERITQHPGYVARGALEGFTLVDSSGVLIGHDESVRTGIDGPVGATGGGITFYRPPNPDITGTYVSAAPVLYPSGSTILTWMDRRLANGIERVASAIAWQEIQGAQIYDPDTLELDPDAREAIAGKIAAAIRQRYGGDNPEFQNVNDPGIVTIDPTVTVNGPDVTISGTITVLFYGYAKTVELTFAGER